MNTKKQCNFDCQSHLIQQVNDHSINSYDSSWRRKLGQTEAVYLNIANTANNKMFGSPKLFVPIGNSNFEYPNIFLLD